jgi:hypothetical protein
MRHKISIAVAGLLALAANGPAQVPGVRRVVIVGVDGMSPDGLQHARTPNLDRLRAGGAYTMHARGVMPTDSSPNWASMIMGAGPEQHGVTSNDWQPDKFDIAPVCTGTGGIFPTIFGVLRAQQPKSVIGCFHDWPGFARLFERGAADLVEHGEGPVDTVRKAIAFVEAGPPTLLFVHLDHVDHAGHEIGHGTPAYYAAVSEADRLIGELLKAFESKRLLGETVFLVTADHGGSGTKHGRATMAELEIPWIIAGPGIAKGRELHSPVNTFDTAATVAHLLGLQPPPCWIGRPVAEAFAGTVKYAWGLVTLPHGRGSDGSGARQNIRSCFLRLPSVVLMLATAKATRNSPFSMREPMLKR